MLSRQETKYKVTAFWLAKCINLGSKLHGVNCFPNSWPNLQRMSWWAGHTNNKWSSSSTAPREHRQQTLISHRDTLWLCMPATLYLQTMVWTSEPWQRLPELNICDHLQMLPLLLPPLILELYIKTPITKQLSCLPFMWPNGPTIFKIKLKTPYNQTFIKRKVSFCNCCMKLIFKYMQHMQLLDFIIA